MSESRTIVARESVMLPVGNSYARVMQSWEKDTDGTRLYVASTTDSTGRRITCESTDSMRSALLQLVLDYDRPPLPDDVGPLPLPSPKRALALAMERADGPAGVIGALPPSVALFSVATLAEALREVDLAAMQGATYEAIAEELIRYTRAHP